MTPEGDMVIEIMEILKEEWSLTGDLSLSNLRFSTRLYDESILLPQIVISYLGGTGSPPIDMGSSEATYRSKPTIGFDIWVRPKQDSASSIGWAKNAMYMLRKETERILLSGSRLNSDTEDKFLVLTGWDRKDDLTKRPPIFCLLGKAYIIKYILGS
jgi:hypothetical protein